MLPPARSSSLMPVDVRDWSVATREDSDDESDKTINDEIDQVPLWQPRRRRRHHNRRRSSTNRRRRRQEQRRRRTASFSSRFGQREAAPATAGQIDTKQKAPGEERETPNVVLIVSTPRTCPSPLPATADNTNTSRCSGRLWKAAAVAALLLLFSFIGCCWAGQRLLFGKSDWRLLLAAFRCDVVDALCQLDAAVCQRRCPPGRLSFLADNNY